MMTKYDYKKSQYKMLLTISVLIFVIILGYTIFWHINYNSKYGYFKKITAEVVDFKEEDGQEYAVITYTVDGLEYLKTSEYTNKKLHDKVTVYYDENNPVGLIYNRDIRYYLLPIVCAFFGLADAGVIVLYIIHFKKKKKTNLKQEKTTLN